MASQQKEISEVRSAGGVVINEDGEILFCHPTGSRWTNWRMPKGVIADGEDSRTAALREVLEETGYRCNPISRLTTTARYRSNNEGGSIWKIVELYLMEPVEKVQEPDTENDDFRWVPIEQVDKYTATVERPLILEAIERFKDGRSG
jgi:8-oxo-dGTP pyrophosphatase MutT (NUDIX family)